MKKNDVVKFYTPLADEDPAARYRLRDDPEECRRHAAEFNKKWEKIPTIGVKVDIEYLGKENADGTLQPHNMFLSPISTVLVTDLVLA